MAPPPSIGVCPAVTVLLRILTLIFLLPSLVILTTNTSSFTISFTELKIRFHDVHSYVHACCYILVGVAYTLLQIVFNVCRMSARQLLGGNSLSMFDYVLLP
ncbi:hypothetical protein NMG60_11012468 [Bertholletia excelsa]